MICRRSDYAAACIVLEVLRPMQSHTLKEIVLRTGLTSHKAYAGIRYLRRYLDGFVVVCDQRSALSAYRLASEAGEVGAYNVQMLKTDRTRLQHMIEYLDIASRNSVNSPPAQRALRQLKLALEGAYNHALYAEDVILTPDEVRQDSRERRAQGVNVG